MYAQIDFSAITVVFEQSKTKISQCIDYRLENGIDLNDTYDGSDLLLYRTIRINDLNSFKRLLENGANPNIKLKEDGDSLYHLIAEFGRINFINYLLSEEFRNLKIQCDYSLLGFRNYQAIVRAVDHANQPMIQHLLIMTSELTPQSVQKIREKYQDKFFPLRIMSNVIKKHADEIKKTAFTMLCITKYNKNYQIPIELFLDICYKLIASLCVAEQNAFNQTYQTSVEISNGAALAIFNQIYLLAIQSKLLSEQEQNLLGHSYNFRL